MKTKRTKRITKADLAARGWEVAYFTNAQNMGNGAGFAAYLPDGTNLGTYKTREGAWNAARRYEREAPPSRYQNT